VENGLDVVVSVRSFPEYPQPEIDLRVSTVGILHHRVCQSKILRKYTRKVGEVKGSMRFALIV